MSEAGSLPKVEKDTPGGAQEKAPRAEGVERMLSGQDAPQEPEQPGSKAEQEGGEAPDGVGTSITRGAEEVAKQEAEPGRQDTGTQGASQRPTGTSTERDVTGVDPQAPTVP